MADVLRDALKAISYLQHRMDQIKAQARDENREVNEDEWAEIRTLVGDE